MTDACRPSQAAAPADPVRSRARAESAASSVTPEDAGALDVLGGGEWRRWASTHPLPFEEAGTARVTTCARLGEAGPLFYFAAYPTYSILIYARPRRLPTTRSRPRSRGRGSDLREALRTHEDSKSLSERVHVSCTRTILGPFSDRAARSWRLRSNSALISRRREKARDSNGHPEKSRLAAGQCRPPFEPACAEPIRPRVRRRDDQISAGRTACRLDRHQVPRAYLSA